MAFCEVLKKAKNFNFKKFVVNLFKHLIMSLQYIKSTQFVGKTHKEVYCVVFSSSKRKLRNIASIESELKKI